jgi:hypothetical protein
MELNMGLTTFSYFVINGADILGLRFKFSMTE